MKYILTFLGGVAVGILTSIGVCAAAETPNGGENLDVQSGEGEGDSGEDPGNRKELLFRDFSDLY